MTSFQLKRCTFLLLLVISTIIIAGCGKQELVIGKRTPKDFLNIPGVDDADFFLWEDVVFLKDWLTDNEYSLGNSVGEITKTTLVAEEFSNGTASKLPVGTKIYLVEGFDPIYKGYESTEILIAVVDGVQIPYLAQIPRIEGIER